MSTKPQKFDFTRFQAEILPKWMEQFKSGPAIGDFSFEKGGPTSVYGTSDMLITKYIIGDLQSISEEDKDSWAAIINQFQDQSTGHYHKKYTRHHQEHTTAYAVAALALIDRKPMYPMVWKQKIQPNKETMVKWIESIDWGDIWPSSHIIAGVPSALSLTNEGTEEFFHWYFDHLDQKVDPLSGFWRYPNGIHDVLSKKLKNTPPKQADLGGAFHLFFMYERFQRKWPYPSQAIDSTLKLQKWSGLWGNGSTSFIDLDALYTLFRSSRNSFDYRRPDIEKAAIKYLKRTEKILNNPKKVQLFYRNTHGLVGAIAAIAECQKFCPDLVNTAVPWRQSLDKACFI